MNKTIFSAFVALSALILAVDAVLPASMEARRWLGGNACNRDGTEVTVTPDADPVTVSPTYSVGQYGLIVACLKTEEGSVLTIECTYDRRCARGFKVFDVDESELASTTQVITTTTSGNEASLRLWLSNSDSCEVTAAAPTV